LDKKIKYHLNLHQKFGIKIINEEIENVKWGRVNENLDSEDIEKIRSIIRKEVSAIFFDLFKKRRSWGG